MPRPLSQTPLYADSGRWKLAEALFTAFGQQIHCSECLDDPQNSIFTRDLAGKDSRDGKPRRQWACRRTNSRGRQSEIRCPRQSNQTYIATAREQLGELVFQQVVQETIAQFTTEELRFTTLGTYLPVKLRGRAAAVEVEVPRSPKRPRLDSYPTTPRPSMRGPALNSSRISETPVPSPSSTLSRPTRSLGSKQRDTSPASPGEVGSSPRTASVDSAPREASIARRRRPSSSSSSSRPESTYLSNHDLQALTEFQTEWQEQAQVLRRWALRGAGVGLVQLVVQLEIAIESIQQVHRHQERRREDAIRQAFTDSSDPRGLEVPINASSLPSVQAGSRSLSSTPELITAGPDSANAILENIPPDSPPPSPNEDALPSSSAGVTILPNDDPELEDWQITSAARALVKRWHRVTSAADRRPIRDEAKANALIGKEFNRQLRLSATSPKVSKEGRPPRVVGTSVVA